MSPLAPRIGQYWLQLPATLAHGICLRFGIFSTLFPASLLWCGSSPSTVFRQRGRGTNTNRGLHQRGVNRVILDSRPVLQHVHTVKLFATLNEKNLRFGTCCTDGDKSADPFYR